MMHFLNFSLFFGLFIYALVILAVVLGLVYLYRISKSLQEIANKMDNEDEF